MSPQLRPSFRTDAGRFRELEVLERLRDCYGEIDDAVLSPDGDIDQARDAYLAVLGRLAVPRRPS